MKGQRVLNTKMQSALVTPIVSAINSEDENSAINLDILSNSETSEQIDRVKDLEHSRHENMGRASFVSSTKNAPRSKSINSVHLNNKHAR